MNPDDVNEPWGVLPDGISVGDRVEGMSCTDLRGRRTGTLVGAGTRGNSPSTVEILDDRDGSPSFVHAGSVKPLESAPVEPVSVPAMTNESSPLQALYRYFEALPGVMGPRGIELLDQVARAIAEQLREVTEERDAFRETATFTQRQLRGLTEERDDLTNRIDTALAVLDAWGREVDLSRIRAALEGTES